MNKLINELHHLISGIKNKHDAKYICNEIIATNADEYVINLMCQLILSDDYNHNVLGFNELINCLTLLTQQKENTNIVSKMLLRTNDRAQINTIQRILRKYPIYNNHKKITKNCPHCGYERTDFDNTNYVICGYDDNLVYDYHGCKNDWCFKCGKKLCKSFDNDQLCVICNRKHDEDCCRICAEKNGFNYQEDYCQCQNLFVNR